MRKQMLRIRGARTHNLKQVDLDLEFNSLVVVSGLSGSGKSSLAFDTIFAEGHRRYVESLSSYARQFLGQMDKPDLDSIEGLTPSIAIDQKSIHKNPRSTVGTITEIHDYMRVLFAGVGTPYCPEHGEPIQAQSIDQMIDQLEHVSDGSDLMIFAPLVTGRKGEFSKLLELAVQRNYIRLRVDGELIKPSQPVKLSKNQDHTIEALIDKLTWTRENKMRLTDSLERSLKEANGQAIVEVTEGDRKKRFFFSSTQACPICGFSLEELSPRIFSFNSPYGACPDCHGLGSSLQVDLDLLIHDWQLSIDEGVFENWASQSAKWYHTLIKNVCNQLDIPTDVPFADLSLEQRDVLLYGTGDRPVHLVYESDRKKRDVFEPFEGVVPNINRRYADSNSDSVRLKLEEVMSHKMCHSCQGHRLKPASRAVRIAGKSITDLCATSLDALKEFMGSIESRLTHKQMQIAEPPLREIRNRIQFLIDVGLTYLMLGRSGMTLSGGEAQRIRLATQIGSALSGVTYVLDEPSIGLHQRDNRRLIKTLKRIRDLGNMVIVVEHDSETIEAADYVVEIGPGAGVLGGYIVAQGTPDEIRRHDKSLTGQYLSGRRKIEIPLQRRQPNGKYLQIVNAEENNLQQVSVDIPLGIFTCVTGVSGSGKSTLVHDILYAHLAREISKAKKIRPGKFEKMIGLEHLNKVVNIDQAPIGKSPRSNPATYTGMFDEIRNLFALTVDAKMRGFKKDRFSFNVPGGRCETCKGDGMLKIEMHFLPDVYVVCDSCHGKRYNSETLSVTYKDKTIADVLDLTVSDGLLFFENHPKIYRCLKSLHSVGLGYMKLGQSATTLSGGEAQRVKLATELARPGTDRTLYILDEPTTGLHMEDIRKLMDVLHALVDQGASVVVIEHNLDVIKTADYILDMGPEGGDKGGQVVATGTPEEVCRQEESITGRFLREILEPSSKVR